MSLETLCRTCGRLFEASTDDVKAGPTSWRICPECRTGPGSARQPGDPDQEREEDPNR